MKKQIFRFILVGILVFVFAMPMLGCGSRDYEFREEDFSLEITASQTTASVGDTIILTATFKNLSGRNIRIQFICHSRYIDGHTVQLRRVEQLLTVRFAPYDVFFPMGYCAKFYSSPRRRTLRRGAVIQHTREVYIEDTKDYMGIARFYFRAGLGFNDRISLRSDITISVI
ncbi:MAG: hypothetical protein FWE22_04015 [Firmicutes bacterium]|nr:hypothetical protein [Bacillota bacterium]